MHYVSSLTNVNLVLHFIQSGGQCEINHIYDLQCESLHQGYSFNYQILLAN